MTNCMAESEETVPKEYLVLEELSRDSAVPHSEPSSTGTSEPSSASSSSSGSRITDSPLGSSLQRDDPTIVCLGQVRENRRRSGESNTTGGAPRQDDCGHAAIINGLREQLQERNRENEQLKRELTGKDDLIRLNNDLKVQLQAAQFGRSEDKRELEIAHGDIKKLEAEIKQLLEIKERNEHSIRTLYSRCHTQNDRIHGANIPYRTPSSPSDGSMQYGRFHVKTLSEDEQTPHEMDGVEDQPHAELQAGADAQQSPVSAPACLENVPAFMSCFTPPHQFTNKRKRFKIEKSSALQCKVCKRVFDNDQQSLRSKCSFHSYEPLPYAKWKLLSEEGDHKPDELYWPCCKVFGKTEPNGCRTLQHHDISPPDDEHNP